MLRLHRAIEDTWLKTEAAFQRPSGLTRIYGRLLSLGGGRRSSAKRSSSADTQMVCVGHHEPPAPRAQLPVHRARDAASSRCGACGGGWVLLQNRFGLRVRGLSGEVVHRRPRFCIRHWRDLLPEPLGVSMHVHRGRSRMRPTKVSPRPPQVHADQIQGVLSGVRGYGQGLCLRGQDVPAPRGVQGEKDPNFYALSPPSTFPSHSGSDC